MTDLVRSLSSVRDQLGDLYALIGGEVKAELRRFEDEKPSLELMISSLTKSHTILKAEMKRIKSGLQENMAAQAKAESAAGGSSKPNVVSGPDIDDLQLQLIDLNKRLLDVDHVIQDTEAMLSSAMRFEEKEIFVSKNVVMQDTKRMLAEEIVVLRSGILRIEKRAQIEEQREKAEESGWAELTRLEEQLAKTDARVDQNRLKLYFPEAKGYRFTSGGGRVYFAAKDLFISEISGRFDIDITPVTKPDGSKVARFNIVLSGVSGGGIPMRNPEPAVPHPSSPSRDTHAKTAKAGSSGSPPSPDSPTIDSTPRVHGSGAGVGGGVPPSTNSSMPAMPPSFSPPTNVVPLSKLPESMSANLDFKPHKQAHTGLSASSSAPHPSKKAPHRHTLAGMQSAAAAANLAAAAGAATASAATRSPLGGATPAATHPSCSPSTSTSGSSPQDGGLAGTHDRSSGGPSHADSSARSSFGFAKRDLITFSASGVGAVSTVGTADANAAAGGSEGGGRSEKMPSLSITGSGDVLRKTSPDPPHSRHGGEREEPPLSTSNRDSQQSQRSIPPSVYQTPAGYRAAAAAAAVAMHEAASTSTPGRNLSVDSARMDSGHSPATPVGGSIRDLNLPHRPKAQKGELVAGFLSSLTSKKEKLKSIMEMGKHSPIDPVGRSENTGSSVGTGESPMMEKESKGRFSKFAKAIASKAEKVKGSVLHASSSVTLSRSSSAAANDIEAAATRAAPPTPSVVNLSDHPFGRKTTTNKHVARMASSSDDDNDFPPTPPRFYPPAPPPPPPASPPRAHPSTSPPPPPPAPPPHAHPPAPPPPPPAQHSPAAEADPDIGSGPESLGFDEFESRPSRKGIYVQLLGEHVEVRAERGTKIPDLTMKELLLEVEVSLVATLEYSLLSGAWKLTNSLDFNILQLEHRMRGNSFPLPKAALKAMLHMFIPGAITRGLLGMLPEELGQYILESGEKLHVSGEFKLLGQSLSTFVTELVPTPSNNAKAKWKEQQAAASRARAMLGLTEMQASGMWELFSGRGHLFCNEPARVLSICELCRFYMQFSGSKLWAPLCAVWNKGLQLSFQHFGIKERINFGHLMETAVARMVRKPVRVAFKMDRLHAALDVDVLLSATRSGFERLAREFHKRSSDNNESTTLPREPLDVQLENLQLWYQAMQTQLRTFKSGFRSASCSVLLSADRDLFQCGAESVSYDGPLKLKIPIEVALDPDHSFVWDIRLPDRQEYRSSLTTMLQEIMMSLAETVNINDVDADGAKDSGKAPPKRPSELNLELNKLAKAVASSPTASAYGKDNYGNEQPANLGGSGGNTGGTQSVDLPVLENPVVGQISVKKVSVSLKLDEERIARLLAPAATATATAVTASSSSGTKAGRQEAGDAAAARLIGQLLGCYGDLFSSSLDIGWMDPDKDGHSAPRCMLNIANNEVTRVRADVDSLMFQSSVSPKVAVRMIYAVVAGLMHKFYSAESVHMRFWDKLFSHLQEYFSKESLDATLCLGARASTIKPTVQQTMSPEADLNSLGTKLRIVLTGDVGENSAGLTNVCPVNIVNDVNLLTLLESYKLAMDRQIPV